MRSGQQIVEDLDKAATGVREANHKLGILTKNFYDARVNPETRQVEALGVGLRFDIALREELSRIYEQHVEQGKRPPAEDIRQAIADKAVQTKDPSLWAEFHSQKAEIEGLRLWLSNEKAAISANQSLRREIGDNL